MPTLFRAIALVIFSFSCTSLLATEYPLTIVDGMGNTIVLQKAPSRISSKTLFTDEIFNEILEPKQLTSISDIAKEANFSNIAHNLPKGVPLYGLNVEQILANSPDILFAANWSDVAIIEQLKQAGIIVYLVDTPFTFEAIQAEILKIANIVNETDAGEQLIATMNTKIAALDNKITKIADQKLVAIDYNTWGTSSGVDTTWNALLTSAGIMNAAAQYEQGTYGQVTMSKELILVINPDILFLPGWIYGDASGAENFLATVKNDPALQSVKAIKNNHIYPIPENLRGTYSQYIADTLTFVVDQVSEGLDK
ncbi:ABC transporter substrate-binding protein [Reinekea sp.]|uniref:ABC transporter substrate-binding protein n=1 Tax=Reinekea sp. TaxID=1970455 RepID=UPI003989F3D3